MKKLKLVLLSTLLCITAASTSLFAVACAADNTPGTGGAHSHVWSKDGTDNGDGTHKLTCSGDGTCDEGGSKNEAHDTKGADGACSVCGYNSKSNGEHKTQDDHTWGKWVLEKDPTWDTVGTATRTCTADDGGKDTKYDVPALSDSTVWTKDTAKSTPATHTEGGKDVYTSVYGEVEVDTKATGHDWNDWVFNPEPTLDTAGKASRTCKDNDGGNETDVVVPKLSDTTVWKVKSHTGATLAEGSVTVYESELFGTVTVYGDPLPVPFYNKTYHSFYIAGQSLKTGLYAETTNKAASITLDDKGEGTGTAAPFNGKFKFEVVDAKTGELKVTVENGNSSVEKKAYVHAETGLIIIPDGDTFDNVHVLINYGEYDSGKQTATASAWNVDDHYNLAIVYSIYSNELPNYDHRIFIADGVVYFDVTFYDIDGEEYNSAFDGSSLYNKAYLYVKDSSGKVLAAYGNNGERLNPNYVALDGLEGNYTVAWDEAEDATLFLSGFGTATLTVGENKYTATYKEAEEGSDYDLYLSTEYGDYELTLGDGIVTLAVVKVTITFDMNGHGDQISSVEVVKNRPFTLPAVADLTDWAFRGWYLNADCTTPVTSVFDEDKTVYANWKAILTITVNYGKDLTGFKTEYKVVDGEELTVDEPKEIYDDQAFEGFYTSDDFNEDNRWENGSVVRVSDNITTIYVKWINAPVPYYGKYEGLDVSYSAYNNSVSTSSTGSTLDIDADGNVDGKFGWQTKTGTVDEYDKLTGIILIKTSGAIASNTYDGAVDIVNGVIVYNYSGSSQKTGLASDTFVMLRGKTGVNADKTNSSAWDEGLTKLLTLTYGDGGSMLVFIWNNRVWGNVTYLSTDSSINAANASSATNLLVFASDGTPIATLVDGTFVAADSLAGIYSHASGENLGEIFVDGAGNITAGGKSGVYSVTETANTIVATLISDSYEAYSIVLNKENGTYVATSQEVHNPVLTIVYNVGGHSSQENATVTCNPGDIPNLTEYLPENASNSNGWSFSGWYEDEAWTKPYTPSKLTGDKIIYAGWAPFVVESVSGKQYSWTEDPAGTWTADNKSGLSTKDVYIKITFAASGTFYFDYKCYCNLQGDGLFGHLNSTDPVSVPRASRLITIDDNRSTTSGTKNVTVTVGDYLCLDASWYNSYSNSNDYMKIFNLRFVAN